MTRPAYLLVQLGGYSESRVLVGILKIGFALDSSQAVVIIHAATSVLHLHVREERFPIPLQSTVK